MPRQAPEPGVDRIDGLGHRGEVTALDDLLDEAQLFVGGARIAIPHRHRRGHIGDASIVRAQFLQGKIGIGSLVGRIAIDEDGSLIGHHFFQDRGDRLALGEPLAADLGQDLGCISLVEQDRAGGPAIGKSEPIEIVEEAWRCSSRKAGDGEDAQVLRPEARFEPASEWLIGEQRVEIHRRFGHADTVPVAGNAGVEVGQRLAVAQPAALGHEGFDKAQQPVSAISKAGERLARINALGLAALIEPAFGA